MDRRRFVLSWGRKIYFGLAWPLFCLVSLVFLKSGVVPKDSTSVLYFVVTTVGYYGFLTSLIYFIFYVPVAALFPSYYLVRLWSAILILVASSILLLDGFVFGEYRFHFNELIARILATKGPGYVFGGTLAPYYATAGIGVFLFFIVWIRGELLWRVMQRRFSNPVKSWYFLLIILFLGISHLIWKGHRTSFYGNDVTLASLFPLNYQEIFYPRKHGAAPQGKSQLNYPKKEMKCKISSTPNIIFVAVENLSRALMSEEETPFLFHLQQHGMKFSSHLSGGGSREDNFFRLIYGLPASYRPEIGEPVLVSELQKAGYEMNVFSESRINGLPAPQSDWETWADTHKEKGQSSPYFLLFHLSHGSPLEIDQRVRDIFTRLYRERLLSGSTIVITGVESSEWEAVPMTLILPERTKGEFTHRTSHYDIVPTILSRIFHCKTPVEAYTFGKDLVETPAKDWEIFGNEHTFRILDFTNRAVLESDWRGRIISGDPERGELILKANRELSRFYR